jgi:hypothetical protein
MRLKESKIKKTASDIIKLLNDSKFNRGELITCLGQVLVTMGYHVYYKFETTKEAPGKLDYQSVYDMFGNEPTLGTSLMRLGMDFQTTLLKSLKESIEERKVKNG